MADSALRERIPESADQTTPAPRPTERPRVLLVDDDPFMRTLGSIQFDAAGFDIACCSDGKDALGEAARRDFDVIVLDIAMPIVSGLEFLEGLRILEHHVDTPVIVLSAWTAADTREKARQLGAEWLTKPATAAQLVGLARTCISQRCRDA